jgi:hypothetical protein
LDVDTGAAPQKQSENARPSCFACRQALRQFRCPHFCRWRVKVTSVEKSHFNCRAGFQDIYGGKRKPRTPRQCKNKWHCDIPSNILGAMIYISNTFNTDNKIKQ